MTKFQKRQLELMARRSFGRHNIRRGRRVLRSAMSALRSRGAFMNTLSVGDQFNIDALVFRAQSPNQMVATYVTGMELVQNRYSLSAIARAFRTNIQMASRLT